MGKEERRRTLVVPARKSKVIEHYPTLHRTAVVTHEGDERIIPQAAALKNRSHVADYLVHEECHGGVDLAIVQVV